MKFKVFLFLFFLISFPLQIHAVEYKETNRETLAYDFNTFSIDGDSVVISGWGLAGPTQEYTGPESHEYYLVVINRKTGESITYNGAIKPVNKTELMRYKTTYRVCGKFEFDAALQSCYYNLPNVGFEFRIPLSHFNADNEYDLKFRVYEKYTNRGYQTSVYAFGVDDVADYNGVRYQLNSNLETTHLIALSETLMIRSGPSTESSQMRGYYDCWYSGTRLYWKLEEPYTNILEVVKTNGNNIDSETWIKMGFNEGLCYDGRSRALNGTNNAGWGAFAFFDTVGTPATIKTTSLNTIKIEELKTYTAEKNKNTKAVVKINSSVDQTVKINAYHNGILIYSADHTFNGTKTFDINYVIPNSGNFKIEVIDKHKTSILESKIYISSKKEYEIIGNNTGIIEVETPVLVIKYADGNIKEYREKIQLLTNNYEQNIVQGRPLDNVVAVINYWYPTSEFSLNNDYSVYALYPSKENTLDYQIINGNVNVGMIKDNIYRANNYDYSYFYLPNTYLSIIEGNLHNQNNNYTYINGGKYWYPAWNETLGMHNYYYIGVNLGVNKITIKRQLKYNINNTMFGNDTGIFKITRTDTITNKKLIYRNKFSYDELLQYKENN